jgi:drug/metabolite transporter (DMT)-like permease
MNDQNNNNRGFILLLLAGFLYASYGVFSRIIGADIATFYQYLTRAGLVIVLLLMLQAFATKTRLNKINSKHYKWILLQGLVAGLISPTFFLSVNNLPLGTTIFLFYALGTIVNYILGSVVHHEKITSIKAASLILGVIGVFLMSVESIRLNQPLYIFYALLAGVFFGLNLTAVKVLNKDYPNIQLNLFNWVGVLIVSLLFSALFTEVWMLPELTTPWLANIALAIVSFCASMSTVTGFKYMELQKGSIVLLSELVFGVLIGWLLYKEIPTLLLALGSIFILSALILPNLKIIQDKFNLHTS